MWAHTDNRWRVFELTGTPHNCRAKRRLEAQFDAERRRAQGRLYEGMPQELNRLLERDD